MKQNQHTYIIPGAPIPRAEPRLSRGRAYDPRRVEKIRIKSYLSVLAKKNNHQIIFGPVWLQLCFYTPMPTSWSDKKKKRMNGSYNISKPDFSNFWKLMEDCGTGILYKDDALVVRVSGFKIWSYEPRTEMKLMEISDGKND